MIQSLSFLQIGLGSMGKRRIRNLLFHKINSNKISGYDVSESRRKEIEKQYALQTYPSFQIAVNRARPDVFIISTPPNLHSRYFLFAARHSKHFFSEISSSLHGYNKLLSLLQHTRIVAAPSCTFRFFNPIKKLKKLIESQAIGQIHAFTYHMGQYLPSWHPWEDYRKVYFSKRVSGAIREMVPFELSWIQWLLGNKIKSITGIKNHISSLDIEAEDVAGASLQMENNCIGTILIDVLARFPRRHLYLIGSKGSLEWDWMKNVINLYQASAKKWKTYPLTKMITRPGYITSEHMYQEEIKSFLLAIQGVKKFPYTFVEDYGNQRLIKKITNNAYAYHPNQ